MANTIIQLRRSTTSGIPSSLNPGELGYSYLSNTLWLGTSNGDGVIPVAGQTYIEKTNSSYSIAVNAFDKANSANVLAYGTNTYANASFVKLSSPSQTITGNLTINGWGSFTVPDSSGYTLTAGSTYITGVLDMNGGNFRQSFSGNDLYLSHSGNRTISLMTNGQRRLHVAAAGNVGIGTTAPSSVIHIKGNSVNFSDDLFRIETGRSTVIGQLNEAGAAGVLTLGYNGLTDTRAVLNGGESYATSYLDLYQGTTRKVRVAGNQDTFFTGGNVGIGTAAPSANLHVAGNVRFAANTDGTNYLEFIRTAVNQWRWTTSGIGDIIQIVGNQVAIPQDVLIQRTGLTVTPTTETITAVKINHTPNTGNAITLDVRPTWNSGSNVFSAISVNVTNTNSTSDSSLIDLKVNGNSSFKVLKNGDTYFNNDVGNYAGMKITHGYDSTAFNGITNGFRQFTFSSAVTIGMSNIDTYIRSDAALGWTRDNNSQGTLDIGFYKDAANTLGIRSAAGGKTVRVYGTYTDASNYERLSLIANTTGTFVQSQQAGTGSARPLYIGANNSINMTIDVSGNVGIGTAAPTSNLHVIGTANITNTLFLTGGSSTVGDINLTSSSLTVRVPNMGGSYSFAVSEAGTRYFQVASGFTSITTALGIGTGAAAPTAWLARDANDILAQRNVLTSTNPQTYRVYGTYTDASNFERIGITANTTGHYIIGEEGGTGSARPLYLGANNSVNMTIDTAGRVGIGTSTPAQKLEVSSSVVNNAGTNGIRISNPASSVSSRVDLLAGNVDNEKPYFAILTRENGSPYNQIERFRIDSSGNVGIGTTNPLSRLTVVDSTAKNGTITLGDDATYHGKLEYIFNTGEFRLSQVGGASLGTTFYTNNSERMRISNTGNVGIGTTSPTSTLHVIGNANITSNLVVGGIATFRTNTRIINTSASIQLTDYMIFASDNITLTLPSALNNVGRQYMIKNSGFGEINIQPILSQTIDGESNMILGERNSVIGLISDNTVWSIF